MRVWRRANWRWFVLAVGLLLGATACHVTTRVAVTAGHKGSGTIAVTVTLDAQAVAEVGNLAQQLQSADLIQAGWVLTGPVPSAGGAETVTVRHTFSTPTEFHDLAAQLAGTGPEASRPFQLELRPRHSWWHTGNELSGIVNLTCGLSCFGDAGLQSALGSSVGVNPDLLGRPAQALSFSLSAALNGQVVSTNAHTRSDSTQNWNLPLGQTTNVLVATQGLNTGHVILTVLLAGLGLVVVAVALILALRRRRARSAPASPPPRQQPPVTSST